MSFFVCEKCSRAVKFSDVPIESAIENHTKNCFPISPSERFHGLVYRPVDDKISSATDSSYLTMMEYQKSVKWEKDATWCRYCGSRKSKKWFSSPWGKNQLCAVHNNYWKLWCKINFDNIKEEPSEPIDISKNTEALVTTHSVGKK